MSAGRATLEVARDGQPPITVQLGNSPIRIGRATDADVHVRDGHISKLHAEVRLDGDRWIVVDVGSRAGVLLNGAKIERSALTDGDVIELGASSPVRITYRSEPARLASTLSMVVQDDGHGGMARFARFFEFSHKLGGGFSLEEVLQDVVDLAIEVTKAERGMLIVRGDGDRLDTKVARGAGGRSLPLDGLRVSETLVRRALATTRPSIFADVAQDADLALAASIVSLELRSAVALPLLRLQSAEQQATAAMTVFGLVYLDSRRMRGGFDGFDLGILARLARDASSVIENARLLREAEEQRRIAHEVKMAREVQAALMPEQFASTATFAIAGTCVPCHDLGGDYVDQFDLGNGRQALVVADVAGKGVAASLLAAALQGALAAEMAEPRPLGEVVARVNRVHCRLAPIGKFVTMAVVLLEPDGSVSLVNAGHCPVLHVRADGVRALTTDGMALGLDADFAYSAVTLRRLPGDALVIYTDGVLECEGPERELFGDERLAQSLTARRGSPAPAMLAGLLRDVETFRRGTAVTDDSSVLVVRRC